MIWRREERRSGGGLPPFLNRGRSLAASSSNAQLAQELAQRPPVLSVRGSPGSWRRCVPPHEWGISPLGGLPIRPKLSTRDLGLEIIPIEFNKLIGISPPGNEPA